METFSGPAHPPHAWAEVVLEERHPVPPGWKVGPVRCRWFESDTHLQFWVEKLEKHQGESYTRYMHNDFGVCIFQEVKKI